MNSDSSVHHRLVAFVTSKIKTLDKKPNGQLRDDTSLLKSTLFDSLALLELAIWIEGELDSRMDLTKIDILEEWDSIGKILDFIQNQSAHQS